MRNTIGVVLVAALVGVLFAASGCSRAADATVSAQQQVGTPAVKPAVKKSDSPGERVEVPPPPFTDGIFPCSTCHADLVVNRTRRALTDMHTDIVLKHDEEHRWCLDCHDGTDRDKLHLASGELVPFDESYRVCGQCHGEKYRDWRAGVHGRRGGQWNGHKTYLLCAHCHNPHQPHFQPIAPKPAPKPPTRS